MKKVIKNNPGVFFFWFFLAKKKEKKKKAFPGKVVAKLKKNVIKTK